MLSHAALARIGRNMGQGDRYMPHLPNVDVSRVVHIDICLHETVLVPNADLDVDSGLRGLLEVFVAWVLVLRAHRAPACS